MTTCTVISRRSFLGLAGFTLTGCSLFKRETKTDTTETKTETSKTVTRERRVSERVIETQVVETSEGVKVIPEHVVEEVTTVYREELTEAEALREQAQRGTTTTSAPGVEQLIRQGGNALGGMLGFGALGDGAALLATYVSGKAAYKKLVPPPAPESQSNA